MNRTMLIIIVGAVVLSAGIWMAYQAFNQPPTYSVTVTKQGNGQVKVGAQAGAYSTTVRVRQGDTVTLTAMPDPGYAFDKWSGDLTGKSNPVTITVQRDMAITAAFIPSP